MNELALSISVAVVAVASAAALCVSLVVLARRLPRPDPDVADRAAQNALAIWERGFQFGQQHPAGGTGLPQAWRDRRQQAVDETPVDVPIEQGDTVSVR